MIRYRLICLGCTTVTTGTRADRDELAFHVCECGGRRYRLELRDLAGRAQVDEVEIPAMKGG